MQLTIQPLKFNSKIKSKLKVLTTVDDINYFQIWTEEDNIKVQVWTEDV